MDTFFDPWVRPVFELKSGGHELGFIRWRSKIDTLFIFWPSLYYTTKSKL
jgi:ABC-type cobalt transport system substrate-binding protein